MSAKETRRLSEDSVIKRCIAEQVVPLEEDKKINAKLFLGLGQDRFEHALKLCVNTFEDPLYNMQAVDVVGAGSFDIIEGKLRPLLKDMNLPDPRDIVYVYNFNDPNRPLPLRPKKGEGRRFQQMVSTLLDLLRRNVPEHMKSIQSEAKRQAVREPHEQWMMNTFTPGLETAAKNHRFAMLPSEDEHSFVPMRSLLCEITGTPHEGEDQPIDRRELGQLTPKQSIQIGLRQRQLFQQIDPLTREMQERTIALYAAMEILSKSLAEEIITATFNNVWKEQTAPDFRKALLEYATNSYRMFLQSERQRGPWEAQENPFLPWEVNVFVDHTDTVGVPVVSARITTFGDAFGMVGRGNSPNPFVFTADHRNLSPGFIHEAAGGFLIISARDVATIPGLWFALKSAIKNGEIQVGDNSPFTSRPETVAAKVRVIMFGPAWFFYLFAHVDDEFASLFKVRGEVLTKVKDTEEQIQAYAAWLDEYTAVVKTNSVDESGKCALIEHARRLAGDNEHLATDFEDMATIIREAAAGANQPISRKRVEDAIQNRIWRYGVRHQRRLEHVRSKSLILPTEGEAVGQIYGLAVSSFSSESELETFCRSAPAPFNLSREDVKYHTTALEDLFAEKRADVAFGFPTRITAKASIGKFGVINVEKEVAMAGRSFQKAGLIVEAYLRGTYGVEEPLAAHFTFVFEQSYGGIDGDSASLAQFYALASALTGLPIKRTRAITGSMSQDGLVQPIGGANEKIEGFFDVCATNGDLSEEHGVLIPYQNVRNLMLRPDVVDAIKNKKFSVWSVENLDQGIEILFEKSADEFHGKFKERLKDLSGKAKELSRERRE